MSSVLTRRVFRQIIGNEPFVHAHCSRKLYRNAHPKATVRIASRSIFGWGMAKKEEKPPIPKIHPNLEKMIELQRRLKLQLRPQPRDELYDALREYVTSKSTLSGWRKLTDLQIEQCLATFKYLQESDESGKSGLDADALGHCLNLLGRPNSTHSNSIVDERRLEFANLIYQEARLRKEEDIEQDRDTAFITKILEPYLRVLGTTGKGSDALLVLDAHWHEGISQDERRALWKQVVRAMVKEDSHEGLARLLSLMAERNQPFDSTIQEIVIDTLTAQDDMAAVKHWYSQPLAAGERPDRRVKRSIAELCMKHGDVELGQAIVTDLIQSSKLNMNDWNVILSWAIFSNKGLQELERLIEVMERRSVEHGRRMQPNSSTINSLVRTALWRGNGNLAERLLSFGYERDIKADAATWLMLVNQRLDQQDLRSALDAFEQVRARAYEIEDGEEAPTMNRLVAVMCEQEDEDMDKIMDLVADMLERKLQFEPPTVSALAALHMRKDELHNAIDLLKTYAQHYDSDARATIRDAMIDFCRNPQTGDGPSWDAYIIVHELFGETPREMREDIMTSFFQRRRPDMAIHVFGHLRQSTLPEYRPTAESYRRCLEGIALSGGDEEIFDTVYNMLKLDYEVDPTLRLNNALMMGMHAARRPERALQIWEQVMESEEGPDYSTIRIALMCCERVYNGESEARKIWSRLNDMGVEVSKELYISYLWVRAATGKVEEAKDMLRTLSSKFGSGPEASTLAVVYNTLRGPSERGDFASWARQQHPETWRQVELFGKVGETNVFRFDDFRVDRGIRS